MKDGKLARIFSSLSGKSVCVLGDFMVDAYTIGNIDRISPEAPVPILHVKKDSFLPGGAGNVVLNLISLGAQVFPIGRIGKDTRGEQLSSFLEAKGADLKGLLVEENYFTTVKNRLIADTQQLLRLDQETLQPISKELEEKVFFLFKEYVSTFGMLAISDYGKGFLSDSLLKKIILEAKKQGVFILVDPKGRDFKKYDQADIIKPNEKEAYTAANLPRSAPLEEVALTLFKQVDIQGLIITRSSKGMSYFNKSLQRWDFSVHSKEVVDVTGAGDTVLASLSLALMNNLDISEAIYFSNICAGIAIEKLGCPQVTLKEVAKRLLKKDAGNKIFRQDHLSALKHILHNKPSALVLLSETAEFSLYLFKQIKLIARSNKSIIVYLKSQDPDEDIVHILSSLKEVDFIIIKTEGYDKLIQEISFDELYLYENALFKALTKETAY